MTIGGVFPYGVTATDTNGLLEIERHRIGFISGNPTTTTVNVCVASLTSTNVTVRCNAVDYVVTMSAANTGTAVFYVGHTQITGLSAGTRYRVKLTQGSVVEYDCAVWTAPSAGTDFRVYFAGCDNPDNHESLRSNPSRVMYLDGAGAWKQIAEYGIWSTKPGYILFVDDLCYASQNEIRSSEVSMTARPEASPTEYNYAVAWANWFGLLSYSSNREVHYGQNQWRRTALRSLPVLPQFGDWEFTNDIGIVTASQPSDHYTYGLSVWNKIFGFPGANTILPPTARNRDASAQHWAITLGDLRIAAPDRVTNAGGGYSSEQAGTSTITPWLGSNQIDDLLDALNTAQPFKIMGMSIGIRYMMDPATRDAISLGGTVTTFDGGTQHPLYDHNLTEYQRLLTRTGATPPSLMDNSATNGTTGHLTLFHGDYHCGAMYEHRAASYTGNAAETYDSWHQGTTNGYINFTCQHGSLANVATDATFRSTTTRYHQSNISNAYLQFKFHCLYADVVGSASPKRMEVTLKDWTGSTAKTKTYTAP